MSKVPRGIEIFNPLAPSPKASVLKALGLYQLVNPHMITNIAVSHSSSRYFAIANECEKLCLGSMRK